MQKQAPSLGRVLTMVVFAMTCFGLLLFLWLSFGGPIPLKPQGYRFQLAVPEATQLGIEAEVRVAGVAVGKVRGKELDPSGNRTLATIELDSRFAPIRSDARAILRQKTLLGETYIELTPGTKSAPPIPENGRLDNAKVAPSVQLDEIFQALDPITRKAFQTWQRDLAAGIKGRGRDFNDALGNLPAFAANASDVLEVLNTQDRAVQRLFKNTGTVFGALTENEAALRGLIENSANTFEATATRAERLAEAISIFPTFLDESKTTLARLRVFSNLTDPLISDLRAPGRDLPPTLRAVRGLSPELLRLFRNLDPLIDASKKGLPAVRDTLRGLQPMLGELGPFLAQLNPILEFLEVNQLKVGDFLTNGSIAIADTTASRTEGAPGHYLRQFGPLGPESLAVYRSRLSTNRGNSYPRPDAFFGQRFADFLAPASFDCNHIGGEVKGGPDVTGCWAQPRLDFQGKLQPTFPQVATADYSK